MRNMMFRSLCCAVFASSFLVSAQSQNRALYVSQVAKGEVEQFYERLAASDFHLVVTAKPVAKAQNSWKVSLNANEGLVLLEPAKPSAKRYAGELFRVGPFIVAKEQLNGSKLESHLVGDSYTFASHVNETEWQTAPKPDDNLALSQLEKSGRVKPLPIDPNYLKQKLSEFSGAVAVDIGGESVRISERGSDAGRENARRYLAQAYQALGFSVSRQPYSTGSNFIAEKAGADPTKFLIISAHLDSVGNAGADDDGAGTISALAVAQALKDMPLKYNLRIVGFDEEEDGLIGSAAYARFLNTNGQIANLIGVFNLEMTGYDSDNDGAFHIIDCDENSSATLTGHFMDALEASNLALTKVEACTNRSDHASFWRYNKPAVVISQNFFGADDNPCYHRSCDNIAQLNFAYMSKITQAVAEAVAAILAR